jgi:hypothetical protein
MRSRWRDTHKEFVHEDALPTALGDSAATGNDGEKSSLHRRSSRPVRPMCTVYPPFRISGTAP